jgi:hypothetical protein
MVALTADFGVWSPGSCVPDVFERIFAAPCPLNTWQFAQRHIILDEKASPTNPGPVDPDVAPHTKFFQECLDNPAVTQLTVKKNSQGAFTQGVLNKIVRSVAVEPMNILYVIDSLQEIKRIARTRLRPMLETCELTRQVIEEDDENELQTLTFYLRDMSIFFSGGGSIGAVANKPITLGVVDEADKIPRMTGNHSHVVEEVKSRFKTVENFKLVVLSAPNEEIDITTTEFKKGTQHKFFVPCPHCAEFQEMVPERVIFAHCKNRSGEYDKERVKREAYYSCIRAGTDACPDGKIFDHHKRTMALRGQWRQTNPNAEPGHVSLESSDLFSLFPGARFGLIALDIIESQNNPATKKAKWSGRFGREWKTSRAILTHEDILALRGAYDVGTLPPGCEPVALGLATDVQGDVRKWVRGAFNRHGDLFITDYGASFVYEDLLGVMDTPIPDPREGAEPWRASEGIIDEGFETTKVRSFCLRANHRFFPAKGRSNTQIRGSIVGFSETGHDGGLLNVIHFNDDEFRRALYIDRIRDLAKIKSGVSKVPRLWLPRNVDADFVAELHCERLVPQTNEWGFTRHVWEKTGTNDWGDAVKLLYVWWFVAGPEILARLAAETKAA